MRISDWSSDVCSSDLVEVESGEGDAAGVHLRVHADHVGGDRPEDDGRQHGRGDEALVERAHDVLRGAELHEEGADWDDDGRGQGLIVLEDLIAHGGTFGHSTQHPGIDGVAIALEGLAKLHGSLWDSPLLSEANAPWFQTSMRTAVDHDQVRILWHWICENLKRSE